MRKKDTKNKNKRYERQFMQTKRRLSTNHKRKYKHDDKQRTRDNDRRNPKQTPTNCDGVHRRSAGHGHPWWGCRKATQQQMVRKEHIIWRRWLGSQELGQVSHVWNLWVLLQGRTNWQGVHMHKSNINDPIPQKLRYWFNYNRATRRARTRSCQGWPHATVAQDSHDAVEFHNMWNGHETFGRERTIDWRSEKRTEDATLHGSR